MNMFLILYRLILVLYFSIGQKHISEKNSHAPVCARELTLQNIDVRTHVGFYSLPTPVCVIVAPLTVIFTYFLFYVKSYLDITEMRPTRRLKALMLHFKILISFK